MYPAFWRLDRHYSNVSFRYTYDLQQEEQITITSEGTFSLFLDGKDNIRSNNSVITLPAGRHQIMVSVFNDAETPALLIEGTHVRTDSSWEVSSYQNDWLPAGSWTFDSPDNRPSKFRLAVTPQDPASAEIREGFMLLDFGKETFGYLRFHNLKGAGTVKVFYGESIAEALSTEECFSLDSFEATEAAYKEDGIYTMEDAKAFRYVWIHGAPGVSWDHVSMLYEYVPLTYRGSSVIQSVLLNPDVPQIRTPYMRFHEMAVLCEGGQHHQVRQEILSYWGGMITLGATTFWEEYDPSLEGDAHYGMYGLPFGKSLCHAWGAGPVYLFGKYFLGVTPASPGYETYRIHPNLGGLEHMKGTVPTGKGQVSVEVDLSNIRVESTFGTGILVFESAELPECLNSVIRPIGDNRYEVTIEAGQRYSISYKSLLDREDGV